MNVNKVIIIGRLTRNPETKVINETSVTNLSVATNYKWKNKDGEQEGKTEFHNVVAWGRKGEVIAEYFERGQEIYVEGRLETRSWDDADSGKKIYRTEIILENFEFGAKAGGGNITEQEQPQERKTPKTTVTNDTIPF